MKGGGRLTEQSSPKESASSSHEDHRSVNTEVFTSLLCSQQERVCRCLGSSVAIPPDSKEKATAFRKEAFTQRSPSPTLGPPPWGALKRHQQKLPTKTDSCLQGSTYNLPGANSIFTTSPPGVVKGNVRPRLAKFETNRRLSLETVTMPQSNEFFQKTVFPRGFFFQHAERPGTQRSPLARDGKGPRNGLGDRSCTVMISPGRLRLQGRNPGPFWHSCNLCLYLDPKYVLRVQ